MNWTNRMWRMMYPYPMLVVSSIAVIYVSVAFYLHARHQYQANPISSQTAQVPQDSRTVILDGQSVHVSIADTEAKRQLGLGGRSGLAGDEGMLFIFDQDGKYAFWMKDMQFPIDIIWIAGDGHIVDIAGWVTPETYPHSFTPRAPARYVLELPAGYAQAHSVRIGDQVQL